jgi:threonine/homoserine/homoserine lactone efflux protein
MSLELWLAFAVASTVLVAIPGPTVMLVVSYALGRGRAAAWATAPGVALGDFTAMTLSLAGAGAVLAASATLFTALKLAGALYLIWLGIHLWRSGGHLGTAASIRASNGRMFRDAFVVTALNPKSIVFFIAFVPQFLDPAMPALPQFAAMEATFVVLGGLNALFWALLAGSMRQRLADPAAVRAINRFGGGVLIGAGLLTALARRTG